MKAASGYHREKIGKGTVVVKRFANGARVEQEGDGSEFFAYDAQRNFLGWDIQTNAERAAENGYVLCISHDGTSDLDLWPLWNAGIDGGSRFLVAESGVQVLSIGHDIYMTVEPDAEYGPSIELLPATDLWQRYWVGEVWQLRVLPKDKIIRLE